MKATTIEQSKRLLDAGVDPRTADAYYMPFDNYKIAHSNYGALIPDYDIPAWTLSALLDLLPNYCILYKTDNGQSIMHVNSKATSGGRFPDAISAAVEMVAILTEKGEIGKEAEK